MEIAEHDSARDARVVLEDALKERSNLARFRWKSIAWIMRVAQDPGERARSICIAPGACNSVWVPAERPGSRIPGRRLPEQGVP